MLPTLFLLGVFLSVILAIFNYRKNPATIWLSLFFFSVSVYCLIHYVLFYSESVILVALFFKSNIGVITLLPGLVLYFYTKLTVTDQEKLKPIDWLHFLPVALVFVVGIDNYFSPWTEKLRMASDFILNNKSLISYYQQSDHNSGSFSLAFFFRSLYNLLYLLGAVVVFLKHNFTIRDSHVFSHQKFMYSWLSLLYILFFVSIVSHSALLYTHYFTNQTSITQTFFLIQLIALTGLVALLFSPFLFPGILYGLPQVKDHERQIEIGYKKGLHEIVIIEKGCSDEHQDKDAGERRLEERYLMEIGMLIDACMKEQQPFLNPAFNMAMLSVLINIPVHHVAYYLKEIKNQSISECRNSWRVEYAKKMIAEGKSKNLTLEAIAHLSGFSARNTFLVSFKKYEKMTPKEYMKNNKS
ncbi:MAG: AraC family transcriptional regulator [Bacteroidetes bacterium]|nr:AraC family transcriptional regulator [Bacteroidota bacterium]